MFYYEEYGEGKPILIIHGLTCSMELMKGCIEPIFKEVNGYKRIYIDLLGMGKSNKCSLEYASSDKILETKNEAYDFYADYVDREYEEVEIDEEIISDSKKMKWLHFSNCMNNGGTSQLFIDFSPSEKGVKGQIVRFLHDPDEIGVIADSFDEYLEKLIESGLDFISEDVVD